MAYQIPPEGWSGPDRFGQMRYVVHGPVGNQEPPQREGYELFFIGVHGAAYTRWTYRPVAEQRIPEWRRRLLARDETGRVTL